MPTDAEVAAALAAVPHASIRSADMHAALEAAEEVRLERIREENMREFLRFAYTSQFPEIRALAAEQDSEPARDKSLWSAAKRYYSDATQGTEGAPTWSALTSEQRDNLRWLIANTPRLRARYLREESR